MNFKTIRIFLLILILVYIGADTWLNNIRATDWKRSLRVVIYPINADKSDASTKYIQQLNTSQFGTINTVLESQGKKFNHDLSSPIRFEIAPEIKELPPKLPFTKSTLNIIWWSIKLRYWAWKQDQYTGPKAQIKAYTLFFDPKNYSVLEHSTGLKKAKIAINHLFGSDKQTEQNNVVLLHELLHTLGATDKYDLSNGLPHFPDGFANSNQLPLYPQKYAEIMGGRIPLSEFKAKIPPSLNNVVIGPKTAKEIGWIR